MKTKGLLALTVATAFLLGQSMTAYANTLYDDGQEHTVEDPEGGITASGENTVVNVDGDVYASDPAIESGAEAFDGAKVNVMGDVYNGAAAYGENSEVTVSGDVIGGYVGEDNDSPENVVVSSDGGLVYVIGNASSPDSTMVVTNGGYALILGDVTAYEDNGDAMYMEKDSSAMILGDLHGNAYLKDHSVGAVYGDMYGSLNVVDNSGGVVGGDLISEYEDAIFLAGDGARVAIEGDVHSGATGIYAVDAGGEVEILGTLYPYRDDSGACPAIGLVHKGDGPMKLVNLRVYRIDANPEYLVGVVNYDSETGEYYEPEDHVEVENEQISNILYIIKTEKGSEDAILGVTGTTAHDEYILAPENTVLTFTVKEGYELKAGEIKVSKNADGTYSLTVPRFGGVTISAAQIIEIIDEYEEYIESEGSEEEQTYVVPSAPAAAKPASAAPVVTGNTIVTTIDTSKMTEKEVATQVSNTIIAAPKNGVASVSLNNISGLDQDMIDALSSRKDVAFELTMNYGALSYRINIPAGFNLKKYIGPNGKIDFLTLLLLFGPKMDVPTIKW